MTTLSERLTTGCHALLVDTEGEHPFTGALEAVLALHETQPPIGPEVGPLPGVCASCGGTGLIHGPGQNGNWTDERCGCEDDYCAGCGQVEPCSTKAAIAAGINMSLEPTAEEQRLEVAYQRMRTEQAIARMTPAGKILGRITTA